MTLAEKLFDAVHESCGLVSCDTGADVGWAPEEAIPTMDEVIAAYFEPLAERVKQTRTAWLEQHGVPISHEFADFMDALGDLLHATVSVSKP